MSAFLVGVPHLQAIVNSVCWWVAGPGVPVTWRPVISDPVKLIPQTPDLGVSPGHDLAQVLYRIPEVLLLPCLELKPVALIGKRKGRKLNYNVQFDLHSSNELKHTIHVERLHSRLLIDRNKDFFHVPVTAHIPAFSIWLFAFFIENL